MKSATLAFIVGCVSAAFAYPLQECLSQSEASTIIDKFISILDGQGYDGQSANATAISLIADDYIEISDSILSLTGRPVG